MAKDLLSATGLKALLKKPGDYPDGDGLLFCVTKAGVASWVYRFSWQGRRPEHGLGPYPAISLADARDRRDKAKRMVLDGINPIEAKRQEKKSSLEQAKGRKNFQEWGEAYIAKHRPSWSNPKHARQWEDTLAQYVYPIIGDLDPNDVDTAAMLRVLEQPIAEAGGQPLWQARTETGKRIRQRIEAILDMAGAHGFREGDNPARWAGHLENLLAAPTRIAPVEHHAALPFDQVPTLMERLGDDVGDSALAFTVLNMTRSVETRGCRWSEIDLDAKLWVVPPERMKSRREHRIPLSGPAVAVLRRRLEVRREGEELVFPGRTPGKMISDMTMAKALTRAGYGKYTVHGMRSAARDWIGERTNFPNHVAEQALGHVVGDKVEASYRRGDLFEHRRRLMEAWGRFVTTPAKAAEVVHLRQA